MWSFERKKQQMPSPEQALPGRAQPLPLQPLHAVNGRNMCGDFPPGAQTIYLGMGCFWGVERFFWSVPGIWVTAVGYTGGFTPNPTYEEVCSGLTGHNEAVRLVYLPDELPLERLLQLFWENHNPTTGMQQAGDIGTQYRSGIYWQNSQQANAALASRADYQARLGERAITTEIAQAGPWYFAENYHQQYLAKNPQGYCNMQTLAKTGLPGFCGK
jgi:peptide-methionine (S)-S-oxide reductase